jgi:hypothetical protein
VEGAWGSAVLVLVCAETRALKQQAARRRTKRARRSADGGFRVMDTWVEPCANHRIFWAGGELRKTFMETPEVSAWPKAEICDALLGSSLHGAFANGANAPVEMADFWTDCELRQCGSARKVWVYSR